MYFYYIYIILYLYLYLNNVIFVFNYIYIYIHVSPYDKVRIKTLADNSLFHTSGSPRNDPYPFLNHTHIYIYYIDGLVLFHPNNCYPIHYLGSL